MSRIWVCGVIITSIKGKEGEQSDERNKKEEARDADDKTRGRGMRWVDGRNQRRERKKGSPLHSFVVICCSFSSVVHSPHPMSRKSEVGESKIV